MIVGFETYTGLVREGKIHTHRNGFRKGRYIQKKMNRKAFRKRNIEEYRNTHTEREEYNT